MCMPEFPVFLCGGTYETKPGPLDEPLIAKVVPYNGRQLKIVISQDSSITGSVSILSDSVGKNFSEWTPDNHKNSRELIKKIVNAWEERGNSKYLIRGRITKDIDDESADDFTWHIIHSSTNNKRFSEVFKIPQTNKPITTTQYEGMADALAAELNIDQTGRKPKPTLQIERDSFYSPTFLANSRIFEGVTVNLIYNPTSESSDNGRIHFCIVPKKPRSTFCEVTEDEYLEIMTMCNKIIPIYKKNGFSTVDMTSETKPNDEHSVHNWHYNLIFSPDSVPSFLNPIDRIKNLISSFRTPQEESLKAQIDQISKDLLPVLNNKILT